MKDRKREVRSFPSVWIHDNDIMKGQGNYIMTQEVKDGALLIVYLKNEEDAEIIQAIERMKAQGADMAAINANIKAMIKTALIKE